MSELLGEFPTPGAFVPRFDEVSEGGLLERDLPDLQDTSRTYVAKETIQNRFKGSTIDEVDQYVNGLIVEIASQYPECDLLTQMSLLRDELPQRLPFEFGDKLIQTIHGIDTDSSKKARNLMVFAYIGTIFSACTQYMTDYTDMNNDIFASAIASVIENAYMINNAEQIASLIYLKAENGASKYIAKKEGMTMEFATNSKLFRLLKENIVGLGIGNGIEIEEKVLADVAKELSVKTGFFENQIFDYLQYKNSIRKGIDPENDKFALQHPDAYPQAVRKSLRDGINVILNQLLTKDQRTVMKLRFGLVGGESLTLKQIGQVIGKTPESVRQIEAKSLRLIRGNRAMLKTLYDYYQEEFNQPDRTPPPKRVGKVMPSLQKKHKEKNWLDKLHSMGLTNEEIKGLVPYDEWVSERMKDRRSDVNERFDGYWEEQYEIYLERHSATSISRQKQVMERVRYSVKKGSDWGKWLNDHPLDEMKGDLHVQEMNTYTNYKKSLSRK